MRCLSPLVVGLLLSSSLLSSGRASAGGAFQQRLSLQGVTFNVKASGEGSQQQLTIQVRAGKQGFQAISETVDGHVVGAEVADLNSDTLPELYVYVQRASSGRDGQLVAYSASRGQHLLPIYLQELSGAPAKGYMGHDEFAVLENALGRRFPIYKEGDTNAQPTGKTRQLQYKLVAGEAGWVLKPYEVTEY